MLQRKQYICITVNGIILQIAEQTKIKGYTEAILESFLPDDSELKKWDQEQAENWTLANNKRMLAVCKFLNDNNL